MSLRNMVVLYLLGVALLRVSLQIFVSRELNPCWCFLCVPLVRVVQIGCAASLWVFFLELVDEGFVLHGDRQRSRDFFRAFALSM